MSNHTFGTDLHYLKKRLRRAVRTLISKPIRKVDNPFATHLPVLIGIARMSQVRRVLEFGCGLYSTLTFLDSSAFPELMVLDSFEDDIAWMDRIARMTNDDPRLDLRLVDKPICSLIAEIQFKNYDLVFVDNSAIFEERAATIREISYRCVRSNIIVVHDYEMRIYQDAASIFPNRFTFKAFSPNTGILWNEASLGKHQLRKLNGLIRKYSRNIKPDDRDHWVEIISENKAKITGKPPWACLYLPSKPKR